MIFQPVCAEYGYPEWQDRFSTGCFQQQNASSLMYRDLSVKNRINRQWNWLLCNEP